MNARVTIIILIFLMIALIILGLGFAVASEPITNAYDWSHA